MSTRVIGRLLGISLLFLSGAPGAQEPLANALLSIDQNRTTVVDRIVQNWQEKLVPSINALQLRQLLNGLRADQLLAASLSGSSDGLMEILAGDDASRQDAATRAGPVMQTKTLGSTTSDVTYTPITPCRLVETRGNYAAVYQGAGDAAHTPVPFVQNEIRSYTLQGANGVCLSQLPPGVNPAAVQLQVFGIPTTGLSGDIEILPQGSAFGSTATMVYSAALQYNTVSTAAKVNTATNQISVQVRGGGANLAIDVVGYFRTPTLPLLPSGSVALSTLNIASIDTRYAVKSFVATQFSGSLGAGASQTVFTFGYPDHTYFVWRAVPTTTGGRVQLISTDIELAADGTYTYYLTVKITGAATTGYSLQRYGLD
jgi:hypothetical protein